MSNSGAELPKQTGSVVQTACGDKTELNPDTPKVMFNGRSIYFCLVECKASFEDDPLNSCLADDIRDQNS